MSLAITSLVFGFISLTIALVISSAQAFVTFKTKNTSGTSIGTYTIMCVCASVCLAWALLFYFSRMSSWFAPDNNIPLWICQWAVIPIILVYLFDIVASIFIITIKHNHIKLCKKLHINEIELSKYLLKQQREKLIKSGNKVWHRKYFGLGVFFAGVILLLAIVGTCLTIFTDPRFVPNIADLSPYEPAMRPYIITLSVMGAATWEAISWPQFIKCIKTKDTSGISLAWSIFLPISCMMSLIYSITLALGGEGWSWNTIGALVFNGVLVNVAILCIKIKNRRAARLNKMTEIEYTQKFLSKYKKEKRA